MQVISALFVEEFNMRQVDGPSTRLDLSGVMFSLRAPHLLRSRSSPISWH